MHDTSLQVESKEQEAGDNPQEDFQTMRARAITAECYHYAAELFNDFLTCDGDYPAWEEFPYIGTNVGAPAVTIVCNRLFYLSDSLIVNNTSCQPVREAAARSMPQLGDSLDVKFNFIRVATSEVEFSLSATVLWGEPVYVINIKANTASLSAIEADDLVSQLALVRFKVLYHNTMIYPMMAVISPDHPEFGNEHHWSGTDAVTLIEVGKMAQILYEGVADESGSDDSSD